MNLFDLHCDTITECHTKDRELYENDGHISLAKAANIKKWVQVFAIWMPDEYRGEDAISYFDAVYDRFLQETRKNSSLISHCISAGDIGATLQQGRCAAILSVEGGSALSGSLERLMQLYDKGVRLMTLTWNGENEIASGCRCESDTGLTPFGKQIVKKMEELGMVIDLSHIGKRSFYDVAEETHLPLVASHSTSAEVLRATRKGGLDSEISIARNLDDRQAELIAGRGGLIGVNFCNSFLGDRGDDGFEAVYRHISHFLELGCERALALGGDFDGCDVNVELNGIDKMGDLYGFLQKRGLKSNLLDDIFFNNAYNFFTNML